MNLFVIFMLLHIVNAFHLKASNILKDLDLFGGTFEHLLDRIATAEKHKATDKYKIDSLTMKYEDMKTSGIPKNMDLAESHLKLASAEWTRIIDQSNKDKKKYDDEIQKLETVLLRNALEYSKHQTNGSYVSFWYVIRAVFQRWTVKAH